MKTSYVYILSNKNNRVLYIGVTSNLEKRYFEHQLKVKSGFTSKYNVSKLIYLEEYSDIKQAIAREKQLKNWHRQWKINLIKKTNPNFENLINQTFGIPKQVRNDKFSSSRPPSLIPTPLPHPKPPPSS